MVDGGGIVFEVFLVEDRRVVMRFRGLRADREEFFQTFCGFAVGLRGFRCLVFRIQRMRGFLAHIVGARGEDNTGGERRGGDQTNGLHVLRSPFGKSVENDKCH